MQDGSFLPKDRLHKTSYTPRLEFVFIAPGRYEVVAASSDVTELKGMFGLAKKSVSIESMNATIAHADRAAASTYSSPKAKVELTGKSNRRRGRPTS